MNHEHDDPDAGCRLRNNLNPDCLANIFEYLDVRELMTLSRMNSHYKQIIRDFVVPKIKPSVGATCLTDNEDLFSMFGNRLRNFRFGGRREHLYNLLAYIALYCSDTRFNDVEMDFDLREEEASDFYSNPLLMNVIANDFQNLEKFAIHGCCNEETLGRVDYLYTGLLRNASMIRFLKIQNSFVNEALTLFNGQRFANLTELQLIRTQVRIPYLRDFIMCGPKLQRFINDRSIRFDGIEVIGKALAEYCKDTLYTFCDMDPHIFRTKMDDQYLNRYSFITKLKNLREVTLTSFFKCGTDLYYPLLALSRPNKLKVLGIFQNASRCDMKTLSNMDMMKFKLERFTNLHTIKISAINVNYFDAVMEFEFLMNNASEILQNVRQFYVGGAEKFTYPSHMVQLMPNLRQLSICDLVKFDGRVVLSDLEKLLHARGNTSNDRIELVIDRTKCQELEQSCESHVFDKIRFKTVTDRGLVSIANHFGGIFY